jgi:hypothetical protein
MTSHNIADCEVRFAQSYTRSRKQHDRGRHSKSFEVNVKRTIIALVIATLMAVCSGCNRGDGANTLPRELQGAWVTDDSQYAERLIHFWTSEFVVLTGIESQATVQFVEKVDRQQNGNGFVLTIYSKNRAGTHDQMGVVYSPASGGELRFRNQKQVWRRVPQN